MNTSFQRLTEKRIMSFKNYVLIAIILIISFGLSQHPVNDEYDIFPTFSAETLSGQEMTFPDSLDEKVTLVVLAFKRNAQSQVDSWLDPFQSEFSDCMDAGFHEIPMLSGGWRLMSSMIIGGMRSGIPSEKHNNISTYYGSLKKITESLGISDRELAYAFLVNSSGQILWRSKGIANSSEISKMKEIIYSVTACR